MKERFPLYNHNPSLQNYTVLVHEDKKFSLEMKKSVLIKGDKLSQ